MRKAWGITEPDGTLKPLPAMAWIVKNLRCFNYREQQALLILILLADNRTKRIRKIKGKDGQERDLTVPLLAELMDGSKSTVHRAFRTLAVPEREEGESDEAFALRWEASARVLQITHHKHGRLNLPSTYEILPEAIAALPYDRPEAWGAKREVLVDGEPKALRVSVRARRMVRAIGKQRFASEADRDRFEAALEAFLVEHNVPLPELVPIAARAPEILSHTEHAGGRVSYGGAQETQVSDTTLETVPSQGRDTTLGRPPFAAHAEQAGGRVSYGGTIDTQVSDTTLETVPSQGRDTTLGRPPSAAHAEQAGGRVCYGGTIDTQVSDMTLETVPSQGRDTTLVLPPSAAHAEQAGGRVSYGGTQETQVSVKTLETGSAQGRTTILGPPPSAVTAEHAGGRVSYGGTQETQVSVKTLETGSAQGRVSYVGPSGLASEIATDAERFVRAKVIVEQEGHGAAFCRSILANLKDQGGEWTPRQRATLDKIIAEQRPGPVKRRASGRQPFPSAYFKKKQA